MIKEEELCNFSCFSVFFKNIKNKKEANSIQISLQEYTGKGSTLGIRRLNNYILKKTPIDHSIFSQLLGHLLRRWKSLHFNNFFKS